jgi:methionyl-tRNA synthetase
MAVDQHITKKCPSCGQWSLALGSDDDKCQYCGDLLSPPHIQKIQPPPDKKIPTFMNSQGFFIQVNPKDNFIIILGKRIIQVGQAIFLGITTLLVWISIAVAG